MTKKTLEYPMKNSNLYYNNNIYEVGHEGNKLAKNYKVH